MTKDSRSIGDVVADLITAFGGSWKFIFLGFSCLVLWMLINWLNVTDFDPYPFILLNLLLSCVAAFQAPFIMMSQRRAERKQDEAYRELLHEIKTLIQQDIKLEKRILKSLGEKSRPLGEK
jgi:uncharacterized membrane protein